MTRPLGSKQAGSGIILTTEKTKQQHPSISDLSAPLCDQVNELRYRLVRVKAIAINLTVFLMTSKVAKLSPCSGGLLKALFHG